MKPKTEYKLEQRGGWWYIDEAHYLGCGYSKRNCGQYIHSIGIKKLKKYIKLYYDETY